MEGLEALGKWENIINCLNTATADSSTAIHHDAFQRGGYPQIDAQATVTYKMSPHFPREKENHGLEVNAAAESITNSRGRIPGSWHDSAPWRVLSHYRNSESIDSLFSEKSLFGWDEHW